MNTDSPIVLGINCFSHNSSVCVIKDRQIAFHLEEERFDRIKYSSAFPVNALRRGLAQIGTNLTEVDRIAFFIQPWKEIVGNLGHFIQHLPQSLNLFRSPLGGSAQLSIIDRTYQCLNIREELSKHFPNEKIPPVTFVEHHLAHMASCFHVSPFEDAAVLIMDGRGESSSVLMAECESLKFRKIHEVKVPSSIGHFYAAVTHYLGFRPFYDEWKVMGMSAYGSARYTDHVKKIFAIQELGFEIDLSYFNFHLYGPARWMSDKFIEVFGPPRSSTAPLEQRHFDIAHSVQIAVEDVALALARQLRERTSSQNLCMAGGVALNILMNSRIINESGFDNFFIQPIASDSGTSLGSAVYSYHYDFKQIQRIRFQSPYLGSEYSNSEIKKCLDEKQICASSLEGCYDRVAELIAHGRIIGWYQGRMEAGPRSLGNRAILADPRSKEVKDQLNLRIKHREKFRPFAPSVAEEDVHRFFETPKGITSPYMIISGKTRQDAMSVLPAVTHIDGSARVHTVSKSLNPQFWSLLKSFEKISGLPILLNTSFNEQEPIVESPTQAIECFLRTKMDALVIGDYLVQR
jgi:carbamoyltransferase